MAIHSTPINTEVAVNLKLSSVKAVSVSHPVTTINKQVLVNSSITNTSVSLASQTTDVITVGIQGPAGAGGTGSQYAYRRYDQEGSTYYKGWSNTNNPSTSSWKILRGVEVPGNPPTYIETLADGNDSANKVWDNRLALSYS